MPGFNGSTLEQTILFPDTSTVFDFASYLVGAGIEYSAFIYDIDVGNDTISIDVTGSGTTGAGSFNGFRWFDVGNTVSRIASVAMTENIAGLDAGDLTWDEDNIYLNLASLVLDPSSFVLLDINFHPDGVDDSEVVGESGTAAGNVLLNGDTDANGDPLSVTLGTLDLSWVPPGLSGAISRSATGAWSIGIDGAFIEALNAPLVIDPFWSFNVEDGQGGSTPSKLAVTFAPDASDDYTYNYGSGNQLIFGNQHGANDEDTIFAGGGNDTVNGGAGADNLYGQAGDDTLNGDVGWDELFGGTGNDTLNGGTGNDSLFGEVGNDTLNGDAGRDRLDGGKGNDRMTGGADPDRFVVATGGNDVVTDLVVGQDLLELAPGESFTNIAFANTDGAGALDAVLTLSFGKVTVLNTGNLVTPIDLFGP